MGVSLDQRHSHFSRQFQITISIYNLSIMAYVQLPNNWRLPFPAKVPFYKVY